MDNTPRDMDNIGKECRLPFVHTLFTSVVLFMDLMHSSASCFSALCKILSPQGF